MPITFSRTLRSLEGDDFRGALFLLVGLIAVFTAWIAWFFLADMTLYEASVEARLEVERAAVEVQAQIDGRVVESRLEIGREVKEGEILVRLDATRTALLLQETEAEIEALATRLGALDEEISSTRAGRDLDRAAAVHRLDEERSHLDAAETAGELADREAQLMGELHDDGLLSDLERIRAEAQARRRRQLVEADRRAVARSEEEVRARDRRADALLAALKEEQASVVGDLERARARARLLRHDVDLHEVRAPTDGRLAETRDLHPGETLRAEDRLAALLPAALLPESALRLSALFPARAAVGRIHPGRRAAFRAAGFPVTRWGTAPCTVLAVADEPEDGRIRVLLEIDGSATAIPLRHGMPGTVEVEIEDLSPAMLVVRELGIRLRGDAAGL